MATPRSAIFNFSTVTVPVAIDWNDDLHFVATGLKNSFDVATVATGPGRSAQQLGAVYSHLSDRMETCFTELRLPDLSSTDCVESKLPKGIHGFIFQGKLRLLNFGEGPSSPWFDDLPPLGYLTSAAMIQANRRYMASNDIDGILRLSGEYPHFAKHIAISKEAIRRLHMLVHLPWTDESESFETRLADGEIIRSIA